MRGRGDKGETEQRLEINYSKAINAITTVQKDTMILEKTLDEKKIAETIPNGTERNGTERNGTERNGTERQNYCHRESKSAKGLSGQSEGIKSLRDLSINQGNGLQRSTKNIICLNPMPNGTCRTIKSQYFKNSVANLFYQGTYRASGVLEICKK